MATLCYGIPLHQEDHGKLPWNQEETDPDLWWLAKNNFPPPLKYETDEQRKKAFKVWVKENPIPAFPLPYGTPSEATEVLAIPSTVRSVELDDGYEVIEEAAITLEEKRIFFEFCNKYGITGFPQMILMTYLS
jgi:hypothetical protein